MRIAGSELMARRGRGWQVQMQRKRKWKTPSFPPFPPHYALTCGRTGLRCRTRGRAWSSSCSGRQRAGGKRGRARLASERENVVVTVGMVLSRRQLCPAALCLVGREADEGGGGRQRLKSRSGAGGRTAATGLGAGRAGGQAEGGTAGLRRAASPPRQADLPAVLCVISLGSDEPKVEWVQRAQSNSLLG